MVKLVKYITIAGLFTILVACPTHIDENDFSLKIVNNSEEDIVWMVGFERLEEWYNIPSDPWAGKYDNSLILGGNTHTRGFNSSATKENLRRGWIKYYLFNYDSVKTIPWERICEERMILKEVKFDTWEDFERCNFKITYP